MIKLIALQALPWRNWGQWENPCEGISLQCRHWGGLMVPIQGVPPRGLISQSGSTILRTMVWTRTGSCLLCPTHRGGLMGRGQGGYCLKKASKVWVTGLKPANPHIISRQSANLPMGMRSNCEGDYL